MAFLPVRMRATPTFSVSSNSHWEATIPGVAGTTVTGFGISSSQSGPSAAFFDVSYPTNASFGGSKVSALRANNTLLARATLEAEL
jgi:hypothetical protein